MSLCGKTFISTVSENRAEKLKQVFEPLGASLLNFPMTEIAPVQMNRAIAKQMAGIGHYDWIVFTSSNGVQHFFRLWDELHPRESFPKNVKFVVIGKQTAEELQRAGFRASFTGSGNNAADLAEEIERTQVMHNQKVLLAMGNLAPDLLYDKLNGMAGVSRMNVYQTLQSEASSPLIVRRIITGDYDMVLFTSGSAVDHFAQIILPIRHFRDLKVACIGEVTAHTARKYGIGSLVTARESTYEGLAREIVEYYESK